MIEYEEVEHLAELARIDMTEEEKKELQGDLENILGYVDQIKEVTGEVEPVLSEHRNIMRADENPHEQGRYTEDILNEAPGKKDGYFVVKKIIESKK